jgi:glycosyltransferase involved in cell wall biosynthesis
MTARIAIVIPTRHRAALAIDAARSLLSQAGCEISLIVSDNSSDENEVRRLREFCAGADDPRLLYLRPPAIMPLPAHWDWALEQALARTEATHFGIQYDRKLWKPDKLRPLTDICSRTTDMLVTYLGDLTYPVGSEIIIWRPPVSGKLYEIDTAAVLRMTARGMIDEIGLALPLLSNCIVPRAILERVRRRFGTICDSSTPDAAFAFRFCANEPRFLHFDRAATIIRAYDRSNGRSMFTGKSGGTWEDFMRLWGDRPMTAAAPIPDLCMGQNFTFHEYELVRRIAGEERFPPVEFAGYLRQLARALDMIEDPAVKSEMQARLEAHGWQASPLPPPRPLYRRALARLGRLVRAPAAEPRRTFATDADAVGHLLRHREPFAPRNKIIDVLEAVEVAIGE